MVAREQDVGYLAAMEVGWTGVLGIFEQPIRKAFIKRSPFGTEHAFDFAHDGVNDNHRCELTACEHVIAEGDLHVGKFVGTFVDTFIVSAYE